MNPETTTTRIQRMKDLQSGAIPIDYGLHLQDWLSHQENDHSGCPLLDTPFLIIVDTDD